MKRPSKLRVLLAVNLWRIRHKRTPILYLPVGQLCDSHGCSLKVALGVDSVTCERAWTKVGVPGGCWPHEIPSVLHQFRRAFDAGHYPELIEP